MSVVTVEKNSYTVDPLYQWDKNQILTIFGLSLPSIPEIHFTTNAMDRAIVKQSSMDKAGIITVDIPNSLLQKPYTIKVYVCIYEGDTFKSLYSFNIPVKARNRPKDYSIEDSDEEIYSFNALENYIYNTAKDLREEHKQLNDDLIAEHNRLNDNLTAEHKKMDEELTGKISENLENSTNTINDLSNDLRNQITEDLSEANDAAKTCRQAYQDCYDAINTWNFTTEDIDGGDPSTEDSEEDPDDINGGTPN